MVDRSLDELGFERNLEGFMGDMACSRLLYDYPKFTPLHEYIEEIVTDVIWEEHSVDESKSLDAHNVRWEKKLWVDHLLQAHGFQNKFRYMGSAGRVARRKYADRILKGDTSSKR
jgi:hypothetical protein